jgi:hypothetical protein
VKHGLNRRPMSSIKNTLPLDYFTTITSSCIWTFFKSKSNHKSTGPQATPGLPHVGLAHAAGPRTLVTLAYWAARWACSLTGPRVLVDKNPKKQKAAAKGLEPAPLGLERGCSATLIQVCLWLDGWHRPFIMYAKWSTRWQREIGPVLLESWFAFLLLICN